MAESDTREVRVITLKQPHAWSVIHAGKGVENRSRNVAGGYRGLVAIHAGLGTAGEADWSWERPEYRAALDSATSAVRHRLDVRGAIIGVVDLVDVHWDCWPHGPAMIDGTPPSSWRCSPWAMSGLHHLVLENPRPLREVVPLTGGLGLRRMDEDTRQRVLAQIGGGA